MSSTAAVEKRSGIPPHKHCRVCGRSMPMGRDYCTNECRDKAEKNEKRSKRMTRIWMIVFVALMAFLLFFSTLGSSRPPVGP